MSLGCFGALRRPGHGRGMQCSVQRVGAVGGIGGGRDGGAIGGGGVDAVACPIVLLSRDLPDTISHLSLMLLPSP